MCREYRRLFINPENAAVEKSRLAVLACQYTIIARAYRRHANEGQRRTDRSRCPSSGRKSTTKQSVAISVPSIADDRLPNNQPRPLIINGAMNANVHRQTYRQTDTRTQLCWADPFSYGVKLRSDGKGPRWRKITRRKFSPPLSHFAPVIGVTPFEFLKVLRILKVVFRGADREDIVILACLVMIQSQSVVTDGRTDRQTDASFWEAAMLLCCCVDAV